MVYNDAFCEWSIFTMGKNLNSRSDDVLLRSPVLLSSSGDIILSAVATVTFVSSPEAVSRLNKFNQILELNTLLQSTEDIFT